MGSLRRAGLASVTGGRTLLCLCIILRAHENILSKRFSYTLNTPYVHHCHSPPSTSHARMKNDVLDLSMEIYILDGEEVPLRWL